MYIVPDSALGVDKSLWQPRPLDSNRIRDQVWDPTDSFGVTLISTSYSKSYRPARSAVFSSLVYYPYRSPKADSGECKDDVLGE